MSARMTRILHLVVLTGFGISLLFAVALPLSSGASIWENKPFTSEHQEASSAKLTPDRWATAVLPDGTSLHALPGKHAFAPKITEGASGGDEAVRPGESLADSRPQGGRLLAQSSPHQVGANPAPLNPVDHYSYRETFESTDPEAVLGGALDVGSKGAWTATLTGASYRLVNPSDLSAVRYYYLLSLPDQPPGPISQGTASVVVMVEGESDEYSGAGLLFAFEPETRNYYAWVGTNDGYAFYRRDEDGFQRMISAQSGLINQGASNRLSITATGPELQLFVNDQRIARIDRADPVDGGIGIIVLGTGTYTFEEFTYIAPGQDDHLAPDAGSAPPPVSLFEEILEEALPEEIDLLGPVDTGASVPEADFRSPEAIRGPDGPPETQAPPLEWYVAIDGDVTGPFNASDVRARSLPRDTLVWRQGMPNWIALDQIPELLTAPPPPPPPAPVVAVGPPPLPAAPTPPAPEKPIDETQYYVAPGGVQSGPLSREVVAKQMRAGTIDGNTLVWFADLDQWTPLAQTRLAELLDKTTVIPVPAPVSLDAPAHMRGVWQGRVREQVEGIPGFVTIDFIFVFDQEGRFSANGSSMLDLRAQGVFQPVRMEVWMDGHWSAAADGPRHIRLAATGTTRVLAPELDILETDTFDDVSILEILDQDTLRDEDGSVFRRIGH